ncbi:MAG TPA: amidohydrolase [Firmicutes bacterium]|nr:amidohydrolase [Bacillota bacterium]
MPDLFIKGATIVTMDDEGSIIEDGDIEISDGKISYVGPHRERGGAPDDPNPAVRTVDAAGKIAMPGLVNTHCHAAMTLFRGYGDDLPLKQWLEEKIWPVEARLSAEDVYWGTMLGCLEMLRSGTTTFADMYFFMNEVAKAVEEAGLRGVLARGLVATMPGGDKALAEGEQFCSRWNGAAKGRIRTMLGPHAPYTCPPSFLRKVANSAKALGVGIHIHVAETRGEVDDCLRDFGKSPVRHLEDAGLFEVSVLAAHCVHVSGEDIDLLKDRGVSVAHNPTSNMKLASGIAPVPKMLEAGIAVGLGTDGAASNNDLDMFEEMRLAALIHKVNSMDPTVVPARQALEMATKGGARALGLSSEIGSLEVGKRADIILVDFGKPHFYPRHDIISHLVYTAHASDVTTVIVDGKILMDNGKFTTIDAEETTYMVEQCVERLLRKGNRI